MRCSADEITQQASWKIPSNLVFDHVTIEALAEFVSSLVRPSEFAPSNVPRTQVDDISSLIAKYTRELPPKLVGPSQATRPIVVILTGATGNIGSHILASLLDDNRITQVYTLDRPSADPRARIRSAFKNRILPIDLLESTKLVCLSGTLTNDHFGLEKPVYVKVSATPATSHLSAEDISILAASICHARSP